MDMNRRCFLHRASRAAVISGLMPPLSALGGRPPIPIVDTHQQPVGPEQAQADVAEPAPGPQLHAGRITCRRPRVSMS